MRCRSAKYSVTCIGWNVPGFVAVRTGPDRYVRVPMENPIPACALSATGVTASRA